ncbi:MAG: hypothetical protein ACI9VR_003354 [Cognaticolwellia sp.]|jgi:uncharacterized protein YjbI with pentapeptide repeats
MGSKGFAMGGSVGLSSGVDLHTVAHEAAHAVSKNSGKGVSLYGGPDSPSERHANAVSDRVVSGQSAETLLDATPSGGGGGPQLAVDTWNEEQRRGPTPRALTLQRCSLRGAKLTGANFETLDLCQPDLHDADFSESAWQEGAFAGCELPGLKVRQADFGEVLGLSS